MSSSAGAIKAGRAYVEAFMDSSQLERKLGSVKDRLRRFSQQVGAIGGTLAGMGASIVVAMAAAVKLFAAAGDQLDKMSKRSGFAVETLSALDFAASQSGASIDQLDKALAAMARFSLQANRGLATATDTLAELGLTVDDVTKGSAEDKFLKLAQKISEIDDPTLKAGMALQVFGRQGRELLPMLQGGEQGIEALMERARELGIVMTEEDAEAAAEFTDALDELFRSLKFLGVTIARELLPEALNFSRFVTETIPAVREWLGENKEMILNVAKLGVALSVAGGGMIALAATTSAASTVIGTTQVAVKLLSGNLAMLGTVASAAFAATGIILFASQVYLAHDAVQDLNKELTKSIELDKEIANRQGDKNSEVLKKASELEGQEKEDFLNSELKKAQKNLSGMNASLKGQQNLVDELAPSWYTLWQAGRGVWKVEKQELNGLNVQIKQQRRFVDDLTKAKKQHFEEQAHFAGRTEEEVTGINNILSRLNEELETFGMDAGQKAIRELEKLGASESELATARTKLAEISAKEAEAEAKKAQEAELKKAEDEAKQAAETIAGMLQALNDEVSDLKLDPNDRELEKQLRELRRLGASDEQLREAEALINEKNSLSENPEADRTSFTAQSGTFSSLASLMFSSGTGDPLKSIEVSTRETADNTRKMSRKKFTYGA